jgi:hypothetical protein
LAHVSEAKWRDRHARDRRFSPERVLTRRLQWTRRQLESGEGLLFACCRDSELSAYVMVPIDRSTEEFGGQAIAGVNGLAGCFEEGRWHLSRLLRAAFTDPRLQGALRLVQYQSTNQAIALAVQRSFSTSFADRYDVHWYP